MAEVILVDGQRLDFEQADPLRLTLAVWAGFGFKDEFLRDQICTDGTLNLELSGDEQVEPLGDEDIETLNWTLENQVVIQRKILAAIFDGYAGLQKQYGYDESERHFMPDISAPSQLKPLLFPISLFCHGYGEGLGRTNKPCVGFEFNAKWDAEHGCGVLLRGLDVDEIGGADVAFRG